MKAQHFVHKPTTCKAFKLTESFLEHLVQQVPQGSEAPLDIMFDGVKTGAVFNPKTKIVTVPKGKNSRVTLLLNRWFIYNREGKPDNDIVADDLRFHQLYGPNLTHEQSPDLATAV